MNSMKVTLNKRRCIVPGCASSRHSKHHQFPKDEKQGLLWLEAVSNPLLKNLTFKEIYKSGYRVCYSHLREQDYLCGPRNLSKKKKVPSVLLPEKDGNGLPGDAPPDVNVSIDLDDGEGENVQAAEIGTPIMNFSPIYFRKWISNSPGSGGLVRRSSLDIGKKCSSPLSGHGKRMKRKFDMDIQEPKEEISKKHEESVGIDAGLVIDGIEEVKAEQ